MLKFSAASCGVFPIHKLVRESPAGLSPHLMPRPLDLGNLFRKT